MLSVSVDIPDEVLYETKMNSDSARSYIKSLIAINYYTQNGVSLGYCAEIAGMSKEEFMKLLGKNHISVFQYDDEEEFLREMNNA